MVITISTLLHYTQILRVLQVLCASKQRSSFCKSYSMSNSLASSYSKMFARSCLEQEKMLCLFSKSCMHYLHAYGHGLFLCDSRS